MAQLPEQFDGSLDIAIIGGTGLDSLDSFKPVARLPFSHPALQTPWGQPSSPITVLEHARSTGPPLHVACLARHGLKHEFAPHEVNSRANIAALRKLGVRCILAFSAVGSLQRAVRPRDFVLPDQVIDRTKGVRPFTFFEDGVVVHVPFANPFDDQLRAAIFEAVHDKGVLQGDKVRIHENGTLICMGLKLPVEGPAFSTVAESRFHSQILQASVINMSCIPEAKLAREAELSYAMICMSTDYDAGLADAHASAQDEGESVSVQLVMAHMAANAANAHRVIAAALDALGNANASSADGKVAYRALVRGERWKGGSRAGLTGLAPPTSDRGRRALHRMEWLFPGEFSQQ